MIYLLILSLFFSQKDESSKHLIQTYDKFRDLTILRTKPDDVDAFVGKDRTAIGFSAMIVTEGQKKPEEVYLYFTRETFSTAGSMRRGAYEVYDRRVRFQRDDDVILLLDGERIKLMFTQKEYGLDNSSQWREGFYTAVSLLTFKRMAEKKWEMAVGGVEINFSDEGKTLSARVRPRLQALAAKL